MTRRRRKVVVLIPPPPWTLHEPLAPTKTDPKQTREYSLIAKRDIGILHTAPPDLSVFFCVLGRKAASASPVITRYHRQASFHQPLISAVANTTSRIILDREFLTIECSGTSSPPGPHHYDGKLKECYAQELGEYIDFEE